MNRYLETACGWFGAMSCESASSGQVFAMVFACAFAGIGSVWLFGKIKPSFTG